MKKKTVKFFSFLFVAITLFVNTAVSTSASSNTIDAFGEEMEFSNKARAIYLYNTNANKVLFSTGDNEIMDVGPIAKVMTGLIACETLSDRLHTPVNITTQMVNGVSGNSMQLKDGMTLEIEDLLFGTICGGNNDAAQAIAMICESNISAFVQRMNAYASELGMTNTHFSNPTGLDDTPSQTTISDVAKLVKKASKNELYMKISSAKSRKISDEITVLNRNALISQFSDQRYYNKNAKGIIAGSTNSSGYTVATYADNGNTSYICIVMGAVAEADHTYSYYIANKLIDFAFNNFSSKKIISANDDVYYTKVKSSLSPKNNSEFACTVPDDVYAFVENNVDIKNNIQYKFYLHDSVLNAPISANTIVGGLDIYCNGELVATSELIMKDEVKKNNILFFLNNTKQFLLSRYFIIFVVICIPSVLVYLYLDYIRTRHKKVNTVRFKRFY